MAVMGTQYYYQTKSQSTCTVVMATPPMIADLQSESKEWRGQIIHYTAFYYQKQCLPPHNSLNAASVHCCVTYNKQFENITVVLERSALIKLHTPCDSRRINGLITGTYVVGYWSAKTD